MAGDVDDDHPDLVVRQLDEIERVARDQSFGRTDLAVRRPSPWEVVEAGRRIRSHREDQCGVLLERPAAPFRVVEVADQRSAHAVDVLCQPGDLGWAVGRDREVQLALAHPAGACRDLAHGAEHPAPDGGGARQEHHRHADQQRGQHLRDPVREVRHPLPGIGGGVGDEGLEAGDPGPVLVEQLAPSAAGDGLRAGLDPRGPPELDLGDRGTRLPRFGGHAHLGDVVGEGGARQHLLELFPERGHEALPPLERFQERVHPRQQEAALTGLLIEDGVVVRGHGHGGRPEVDRTSGLPVALSGEDHHDHHTGADEQGHGDGQEQQPSVQGHRDRTLGSTHPPWTRAGSLLRGIWSSPGPGPYDVSRGSRPRPSR